MMMMPMMTMMMMMHHWWLWWWWWFVFQYFLQNRPFEVGIDFWSDLGANMPPFSFQKPTKNALKLELGRHQFFGGFLHRFFIDFPSIWEANLGLCWPLRRAQDASKRPPRWLPRRSASHFSILIEFWWILDGCLVDFWFIFPWAAAAGRRRAAARLAQGPLGCSCVC